MTANIKGDLITKTTTGSRLSEEMIRIIGSLQKGAKVYIEEIKAMGPDGTPRKLSPINLKIN